MTTNLFVFPTWKNKFDKLLLNMIQNADAIWSTLSNIQVNYFSKELFVDVIHYIHEGIELILRNNS